MKKGIFYGHQGWTDIINCLALINYYSNIYDKIYIIMREDAHQLINYYIKNISNIQTIYLNKNYLDNNNIIKYIEENKLYDCDYLFHGIHDVYRTDKYKNSFPKGYFVNAFYLSYEIDYLVRINNFIFQRDYSIENNVYNNFIKKYSSDYILHHEINELNNNFNNINYVNLNGISDIFFDYVKVLENAREIHLLDSVWGAIIYLLDSKYKLFSNIKIYLYCKRGHSKMFTEPIKLDNWIIC